MRSGIRDLVERGRAFGAVASARAGMLGVALELADLQRLFVDIGEKPAGRFTVEAGRGHEHVALLDSLRPGARVELAPVVPSLLAEEKQRD